MWLGAGGPFRFVARFDVIVACFESEDTLEGVYDLVETLFNGSCDVFVHKDFPSLGCNMALPNTLYRSHVSHMYFQPSPSPEYYIDVPINKDMIFYANNDLDCEDNMFSMLGENVNDYVFCRLL